MVELKLNNSTKVTLVDDEDYQRLRKYVWDITTDGYVRRRNPDVQIAQEILNYRSDLKIHIDHIDLNPLNNQKSNLRLATSSQNKANVTKREGKFTSQYKGVSWCRLARKWKVKIKKQGKSIHLGYFTDEVVSAKAYNIAATKHFGEFARLNII